MPATGELTRNWHKNCLTYLHLNSTISHKQKFTHSLSTHEWTKTTPLIHQAMMEAFTAALSALQHTCAPFTLYTDYVRVGCDRDTYSPTARERCVLQLLVVLMLGGSRNRDHNGDEGEIPGSVNISGYDRSSAICNRWRNSMADNHIFNGQREAFKLTIWC